MLRRINATSIHGMIRSGFIFTIGYTCTSFKNYIDFHEENFNSAKKDLDKQWEKLEFELERNKYDYEDGYAEHLKDNLIEKSIELHDAFTSRFRESIIIQLYSYLEKELGNITYQISRAKTDKDSRNKIIRKTQGSFLDKHNAYLKKYTNIDLQSDTELYTFIDNFRLLRNVIVHAGGRFDTEHDYPEVIEFAENNFKLEPYIAESATCNIVLDKVKFLELCISNVEKFLHSTLDFEFKT